MAVGQLVADDPRRARLFDRLGIDYCCGGRVPLERACREKGLDAAEVLRWLAMGDDDDDDGARGHFDGQSATMVELIDHIVATHHAYLFRELPRLAALIDKVVRAHDIRHPELHQVRDILESLSDELKFHMLKEEKILFPAITRLEAAAETLPSYPVGVAKAILAMESEHRDAGAAMARLRELTDGFAPPSDACPTYRALLEGLAALEADLHVHIHEENSILFPRACAAEEASRAAAANY
jgi:regulator of cell morphogenesis and NO signaling